MAAIAGRLRLTAAESFWYVLGCIAFGGMYFAKVPAKKALSEAGLAAMTSGERFWYVLQCIAFGAGYFAKVPVKKALTEMTRAPAAGYGPGPGYSAVPQLDPGYGSWARDDRQPESLPAARPGQRHGRHGAGGRQD
jgi:hypothetical protein